MLLESFCFSFGFCDMVSGSCQPCRLETLSLHLWNQRLGFADLFKKLNFVSVRSKALEITTLELQQVAVGEALSPVIQVFSL